FHSRFRHYIKAVDDVSLTIEKGKVFVLGGGSGSGKTTLARLILRAIDPDSGSILFDGEDITTTNGKKLKKFRINTQMIHQDPYTSINPRMKIMDIIMEPLNIYNKQDSKQQHIEKVLKSLEEVRLEPAIDIAEKFPHMLSGGQRQRVSMARALVLKPKLIVADEPVSMLDVSIRAEILELMKNLKDRFQISYLYITHDLSTARYIGDNIAIMLNGKIVETGPIEQVVLNPLHPYTQALIDAVSEPNPDNNLQNQKQIRIRDAEETILPESGCKFFYQCPYSMNKCKNEPKLSEEKKDHYVSCFIYPQQI
ncbi:MAG TPA: ABC transporter ATP-binding protein, partial [Candidatus Nitrosocosmicus sp.]|nr:ABC transporter ATP-binding protein [Candidatus Nitrosocosmicus sp.]